MDELLREFLTETNESLDTVDLELVRFEQDPNNAEILGNIFRLVHTIKGTCGFLDLPRLEALAHAAETLMSRFRDGAPVTADAVTLVLTVIDRIKEILAALEATESEPAGGDTDLIGPLERMASAPPAAPAPVSAPAMPDPTPPAAGEVDEEEHEPKAGATLAKQSIRVHVDTLEQLMTMVSELVLTRNQLLDIARKREDPHFSAPLQRLSSVTAELQDGVMKTRMQPIGVAWQKLPRVVRDLGAELGKDIALQMLGADTDLDRQVLELIRDPLTHMVRNSADHGLETPAERRACGKAATGTIRLSAQHEGGHIIIEIADDGRGLDTERIKAKALAAGLATPQDLEAMSEAQVHKFIFVPGLSTARRVTSISGRGVGMDVVKSNIEQIGGTVDVKSVRGAGTVFVLKIPLTLAIVSALIVECDGHRFAIPQLAVIELVRAQASGERRIERIKGAPVLRLRNRLLPLVQLGALLGTGADGGALDDGGFVVVTQVGGQRFGIVVDAVFHTEEIVVKPMASKLRHIGFFSGNTILGDGSVILIIDPNGVAQSLGSAGTRGQELDPLAAEREATARKLALLVFRAGSREPKAVPLSLVTRLEEIDGRAIEMSNGRHLVQYRGRLMPLVRANDAVTIKSEGVQPVLVFAEEGRAMGLVVDEIVDIVEDNVTIELASTRPGVLGSALVKGRATEIVDVGHFLPLAFEDWFRGRDVGARLERPRLLLVDDSAFFRDMLRPLLEAAGYAVTTAAGGAEALALLGREGGFAAIVCDVEMPGMDGLAFAAAVRADPRFAGVPLIALSSHLAASLVEPVRAAGFDSFVAKFDRPGLIAAVKDAAPALERAA
jgi:two-component system chemotaxis sensor kinase CheA